MTHHYHGHNPEQRINKVQESIHEKDLKKFAGQEWDPAENVARAQTLRLPQTLEKHRKAGVSRKFFQQQ